VTDMARDALLIIDALGLRQVGLKAVLDG
jgi:hypothetical protein